jgi:S1/P1 Nuclease
MILSRSYRAILCLTLATLGWRPACGWAWGNEGHRIIALVADRLLQTGNPAVQRKLAEILATDTSNDWTSKDISGEATWADALREKSPEGRAATSKWHYVKFTAENPDLKKACFGRPSLPALTPASHAPQDNCIVDKIEQFAKELRDPATLPGERLMALQFLLNLVGDIHDPLYTIERNDQSGRCVAVVPPGSRSPVRLSVYWDDTLVAEAEGKDPVKAAAQIAAGLTAETIEKWSGGGPDEWAQESYNLAKAVVYSFPTDTTGSKFSLPAAKVEKNDCGPINVYRLDIGYRDRAIAAVKQQLAKAGIRLAALLRESLQ